MDSSVGGDAVPMTSGGGEVVPNGTRGGGGEAVGGSSIDKQAENT